MLPRHGYSNMTMCSIRKIPSPQWTLAWPPSLTFSFAFWTITNSLRILSFLSFVSFFPSHKPPSLHPYVSFLHLSLRVHVHSAACFYFCSFYFNFFHDFLPLFLPLSTRPSLHRLHCYISACCATHAYHNPLIYFHAFYLSGHLTAEKQIYISLISRLDL